MSITEEMNQLTKEDACLAVELEIPQFLLRYKHTISNNFVEKNPDKYFFVTEGKKFGLSECLVNQLMAFSYELGRGHGEREGKVIGYRDAMDDAKERLGF